MIRVPIDDDRTFNNPDGFAMVFDRTWKQSAKTVEFAALSIDERIDIVIKQMEDHPFLQTEPEQARQVAIFRVRLLNLDNADQSSWKQIVNLLYALINFIGTIAILKFFRYGDLGQAGRVRPAGEEPE